MNIKQHLADRESQYNGSHFTAPWLRAKLENETALEAAAFIQSEAQDADERDIRCANLDDCIEYIQMLVPRKPINDLKRALSIHDPEQRKYAACVAAKALIQELEVQ